MNTNEPIAYRSLSDIRARKEELLKDIHKDGEEICSMWRELFHEPGPAVSLTPSKRFNTMLNTGAKLLDAAILGWKLYHKFSGKSLFGSTRRKI